MQSERAEASMTAEREPLGLRALHLLGEESMMAVLRDPEPACPSESSVVGTRCALERKDARLIGSSATEPPP
jgi:hypothetical protein